MNLMATNLFSSPETLALRDIHLPPPPSWWPPPWPSWLLLFGLPAALLALGIGLRRLRQKKRASVRCQAHTALMTLRWQAGRQEIAGPVLLQALSGLLRRVAISIWPRQEVASLTGEDWLRFLDQGDPQHRFSRGAGRVLAHGPYRQHGDLDEQALFALVDDWLQYVTSRTVQTTRLSKR